MADERCMSTLQAPGWGDMFLAQCLVERLADRATEMTSVVRAQEEDAFVGHIEAAAALLPAEDMGLYWRYLAYWLDQTGVG